MKPRRLALDIETDTSVNGLVPRLTKVISVAGYLGPADHAVFDAPDERQLLDDLAGWIETQGPVLIETWNGCRFDLPMLAARAIASGSRLHVDARARPARARVGESVPAAQVGRLGFHDHCDLMIVWRNWARRHLGTCRLKVVARAFDLVPIELDATNLSRCQRSQIAAYNLSDARVTWLLGAIGLAEPKRYGLADHPFSLLPQYGSALELPKVPEVRAVEPTLAQVDPESSVVGDAPDARALRKFSNPRRRP